MPESLHSTKPRLAFAKLAATPTETSWSQAYNAGNLFACLSLAVEEKTETSLQALGKEVLSSLEAEFFTLEEKTLPSISQAITTSLENLSEDVHASFTVAFFKEDVLYLFIYGAGRILMKREGNLGILLEKHPEESGSTLTTASGYVKNNDIVLLQTQQCAANISEEILTAALEISLPNDIAEILSPQLHEKEDGGQAAIIIVYHGKTTRELEDEKQKTLSDLYEEEQQEKERQSTENIASKDTPNEQEQEEEQQEMLSSRKKYHDFPKMKIPFTLPLPHKKIPSLQLNHRKKILASIAIIILLLLGASIYFTKSKEDAASRHEAFLAIYEPAQQRYDEAVGLKTLNKSLSEEGFRTAQSMVEEQINAFPKDSDEYNQLAALLKKIDGELSDEPTKTPGISADKASENASTFLSILKSHPDVTAFGESDTDVILATDHAITKVQKTTEKESNLIANEDGWKRAVSVLPYQGNVYVLDTTNGILKYVPGGGGYGKRDYFTNNAPDLSNATSIAIDGNIWILFADGTIKKYLSGSEESFSVSGLDTPLSKATYLTTNREMDSLYILDQGNSRVVKISKKGDFQGEYPADVLAKARAMEINENDNKIYILSQDDIWEISTD